MLYREIKKNKDNLSILGYGCMRFPKKNGTIDFKRTEKQILTAIENGVNYFDTAYMYPKSEEILGKILKENNLREKVKIADKLPVPTVKTEEKIYEIFEKQLKRLKTDYIDYYMLHNLITFEDWERLKNIGILDFIKEEKKNMRIVNFGFSFHGNIHNFKKIIDDYDWEFAMIQYNYVDENYQAGKKGLEYAASKGVGVIIMEPLKGGMLVDKLPKEGKKIIDNFKVKKTPAEWGLRWVWNQPEPTVVLSGMNDEKHVENNIKAASTAEANSLTEEELEMIGKVKKIFESNIKVNCTNCAYCLPCPQGVDIPTCFSSYNDKSMFGGVKPQAMYVFATGDTSGAYKCTQCGVCEKKCPQEIAIMDELKKVNKSLDHWYFRILLKIVKFIMYR